MPKKKTSKLTEEQIVKIKLHTLALLISGWYPAGHPEAKRVRRFLVDGVIDDE